MSIHENPYDFERPVKDPNLFAGRQKEMNEIGYYLELSKSRRPVFHNLAIIGPRAIGKTSLLNMIGHMAETKGMLAVKIALNNETSSNEVLLFKEIFDNIMTKGAKRGMYGGLGKDIYRSFRKVIDLFDISAEIPFLFGTAYIGYKKGEKTSLSQQVMVHDLEKIYQEAKSNGISTIVLLFDESDLFSQNKTLLQKLRNVFSELDGYVLVFCGTEKMFPDMSDVVSPVPRLFKRIDVGNFPSIDETKDCILKPLNEDEKKKVNVNSMAEIHAISNGNPYEVQLLSHFMYKRFKDQNLSDIRLDVEVLDSAFNEIERLRLGGHHEIADIIRKLVTVNQLKVALAVLECPNVTPNVLARFITLSEIDSIDINEISSNMKVHELNISSLDSIIKKDEQGTLSFAGDQFDVLYLKHYAISRGLKEFNFGIPNEIDINIQTKFSTVLLKDLTEYQINVHFDKLEPVGSDGIRGKKFIFGGKFRPKPSKSGKWTISFSLDKVDELFYNGAPNSFRFRVNIDFLERGFVIQILTNSPEDLAYVKKRVDGLKTKLQVLGLQIIPKDEVYYNLEGHKHSQNDDYSSALTCFDEAIKLNEDFELAWANKGHICFKLGKYPEALKCYEKWSEIRPRKAEAWERVGAVLIHLERYGEANDSLKKATDLQPELWVAWDNRGRALRCMGLFDESIEAFDRAIALNPDNTDAFLFKASVLCELGKLDEAIDCYEKVLRLDGNNIGALVNKGRILREKGEFAYAIEMYTKALLLSPDDITILGEQALAYDLNGMTKEAVRSCNLMLEIDSNNAVALYNRACFNCKLGNIKEAILDLERAIDIDATFMKIARTEKDFDGIKDNPDFLQLTT